MKNIINVEGGYAVEGVDKVYETKAQATKARDNKDMPQHTKKVAKKTTKRTTRKKK